MACRSPTPSSTCRGACGPVAAPGAGADVDSAQPPPPDHARIRCCSRARRAPWTAAAALAACASVLLLLLLLLPQARQQLQQLAQRGQQAAQDSSSSSSSSSCLAFSPEEVTQGLAGLGQRWITLPGASGSGEQLHAAESSCSARRGKPSGSLMTHPQALWTCQPTQTVPPGCPCCRPGPGAAAAALVPGAAAALWLRPAGRAGPVPAAAAAPARLRAVPLVPGAVRGPAPKQGG